MGSAISPWAAAGDDTGGNYRGALYVLLLNPNGTVKSSQKIAHGVAGGPVLADLDFFGGAVANLGDLDGDGRAELAVGALGDDTAGNGRGAVHVLFLDANGTVKSSQKIASGAGGGPPLADGDGFGRSVGFLGDLDGDGVTDLAVGAYRDDAGGSGRGALHVLLLNSNGTVKSSQKIASDVGGGPTLADDARFGSGVARIGDLDGDGLPELAVGAETDYGSRGTVHVLFLTAPQLRGDYNDNGTVDMADFVLWRNGGPLRNEGVTPGAVTQEDYGVWRANFGRTLSTAREASVLADVSASTSHRPNIGDSLGPLRGG